MARKRKQWNFRLNDTTQLDVSAAPDATRTQVRRRGRWSLVVGMLLAILTVGALTASADNVVNDVTVGGTDTFTAPGSTTVGYKVVGTGGDGQAGCNAADGSAAAVTISVPAGVTASATSLTFTACNVFQNVTFSSSTPGDYAITVSVSDSGTGTYNPGPAAFTLHVLAPAVSNHAPVLTVPTAGLTAEATSASGATVTFSGISATDQEDGDLTSSVSCTPSSGSAFPLGSTQVNCSVTDSGGLSDSGVFAVTVSDTTAPVLSLSDVTAEATSASGAAVTYSASATDSVDGSVAVDCSPASGTTFALGDTTVNCSATDAHGNKATGSFKVTVQDTTPPTISGLPSDQTVEATGPSGAAVTWTAPTASDLVDGTVSVTCAPASGSTFALGDTTVTCSATDAHNNKASKTFKITVQDTTPPTISGMPSDQTVQATSASGAIVTWTAPTSTDLVDGTVAVTCLPASGSTFAPGTTTVTCSATDAHSNKASKTFKVTVSFNFIGFLQPVDNKILNGMKAGSTAPIKWQVSDGNGGFISDLSIVKSEESGTTACDTSTPVDTLEQTATGGTSLRYDTTNNQFVYNWQSPKQPGKCFDVRITLTDGTNHDALFTLK